MEVEPSEHFERVNDEAIDWAQTMLFEHTRQKMTSTRAAVLLMGSARVLVSFAKMFDIGEAELHDVVTRAFEFTQIVKRSKIDA